MGLLQNATKLSENQRLSVAALVLVMLLTSSRVQAAGPTAALPEALNPETGWIGQDDAAGRGLRLGPTYAGQLKPGGEIPTVRTVRTTVTAYSSVPWECDDTPFITADGSRVRDGIVAANFLRFGTRIRIPELFGDKVFEVHDRMSARYPDRVDVWMEKVSDNKKFGLKRNVLIEIL